MLAPLSPYDEVAEGLAPPSMSSLRKQGPNSPPEQGASWAPAFAGVTSGGGVRSGPGIGEPVQAAGYSVLAALSLRNAASRGRAPPSMSSLRRQGPNSQPEQGASWAPAFAGVTSGGGVRSGADLGEPVQAGGYPVLAALSLCNEVASRLAPPSMSSLRKQGPNSPSEQGASWAPAFAGVTPVSAARFWPPPGSERRSLPTAPPSPCRTPVSAARGPASAPTTRPPAWPGRGGSRSAASGTGCRPCRRCAAGRCCGGGRSRC